MTQDPKFDRTRMILGDEVMSRIAEVRVIILGLGGVGSWCAEGLVRSGLKHLTVCDADEVSLSNINRQLMATVKTIGQPKAEALRDRLLEINPDAEITALNKVYSEETMDSFNLDSYDYIIDAIDTLKEKRLLLCAATRTRAKVFSSMGAACKIDPTKVKVAEFWKVRGCPLGAMLRKRMRQNGTLPSRKIKCVYSDEVLENRWQPEREGGHLDAKKAVINGSAAPVTAIFGMTLAGLVLKDLNSKLSEA